MNDVLVVHIRDLVCHGGSESDDVNGHHPSSADNMFGDNKGVVSSIDKGVPQ